MATLTARGVRLWFDAATGLLERFVVTDGGVAVAPLHRAPWVGTAEVMPPDAAPHMATLGGDFFCAPFAASESGSPLHGWPANSPWRPSLRGAGILRAVLEKPVHGAVLVKELMLRDDHPFVYARHVFRGGSGRVAVANHANVSLRSGGCIRTSPKRVWETPGEPQESDPARGRSCLRYPAQSGDPRRFPGLDGPVDLSRYPWGERHEDFVVGVEAHGHGLGWTAVTRPAEGDVFLSLRNPVELPMTMLWHSNGGRDFAPWSGRHVGCLGVEEGAAAAMLGMSTEAELAGPGALALAPDGTAEVRHVIGALRWPSGVPIADIRIRGGSLEIRDEAGGTRRLPFSPEFLHLSADG